MGEASTQYGEDVRAEILDIFARLRVLGAEVRIALGEDYAWLRENDRFTASGYNRFDAFCAEILRTGSSTVYDLIRAVTILKSHEAVEREYRLGKLSDRHVLDLGAVLHGADEKEVRLWVDRALVSTTKDLRASIEAEKPGVELDEEMESYSYQTSPGLNALYETVKNVGEKKVGHGLSHEGFLRVAVDEAMTSIEEPPEEKPFRWKFADPIGPEGKRRGKKVRHGGRGKRPRPARHGKGGDRGESAGRVHARGGGGHADEGHEGEGREREGHDAARSRPLPPRIPSHAEIASTRRTLMQMREMMAGFHASVSRRPTSYIQAVAMAEKLQVRERTLYILGCKLVSGFLKLGSAWFAGTEEFYEAVASALGVCKRTAQSMASDACLFETRPRIRKAYEQGRVTITQAHLIDALGFQTEETYLRDAAELTSQAFQAVAGTMLRVKDFDGRLFCRVRGRMDYRRLMAGLIHTACARYGLTRADIRSCFRNNKLETTTPAHLRGVDPRHAPILLRRLQVLLDLLGARAWRNEIPEKTRLQLSGRTRRVTRRLKSSTKKDLLDIERRVREWIRRKGEPCTREDAIFLLLVTVLEEWLTNDPALRIDPVMIRDDYRCMVPGCSARGHLHDHHIDPRSQGGSNEMANRLTLCWWHHRQIHEGKLTVTGRADGILYWKIGAVNPRYYKGNVRLKVAARRARGGRRCGRRRV